MWNAQVDYCNDADNIYTCSDAHATRSFPGIGIFHLMHKMARSMQFTQFLHFDTQRTCIANKFEFSKMNGMKTFRDKVNESINIFVRISSDDKKAFFP